MAVETCVSSVTVDVLSGQPIVVLKGVRTQQVIPVRIGAAEARQIDHAHRQSKYTTPAQYDLIVKMLEEFKGTLVAVALEEGQNGVLTAYFKVSVAGGKDIIFDCRPSDGIALAVKTGSPIWVSSRTCGVETKLADDEVDREAFQSFVKEIKASDFKLTD